VIKAKQEPLAIEERQGRQDLLVRQVLRVTEATMVLREQPVIEEKQDRQARLGLQDLKVIVAITARRVPRVIAAK
jgi:hypothetical protein